MQVNKFCGIGFLAAVAQKAIIQYLNQCQKAVDGNNGGLQGMLAGMFNVNLNGQNNQNEAFYSKLIDDSFPLVTLGNALVFPGLAFAFSFAHIFLKFYKLNAKMNIRNPNKLKKELHVLSIANYLIAGLSVLVLLAPSIRYTLFK